jgi:hypothetical protein
MTCGPGAAAFAAEQAAPEPSEALFIAQIVLLLLVGRLLGEMMQRIGQPAVMGQLIAGIILGPSVFGAIWPEAQHAIFAEIREQNAMIEAVSDLGILMLLLLTSGGRPCRPPRHRSCAPAPWQAAPAGPDGRATLRIGALAWSTLTLVREYLCANNLLQVRAPVLETKPLPLWRAAIVSGFFSDGWHRWMPS